MPNGPIMIDLKEGTVLPEEEEILKHPMVGGVVLFFKNCKSVEQLKKLIARIRELRPEILIAVDREGGNVQRFQKAGFRCWPAARVYGEVYDQTNEKSDYWKEFTKTYAEGIGEELRSLDIDIDLAPVLDSHSDNEAIGGLDRAFHTDPLVRTKIGKIFTEGLQSKGRKSTGKHFPDHGIGTGDSHTTKPTSNTDQKTLFENHLMPYRELIKTDLDIIMPAHITYTTIDPENPAGFSKIWLNDILRKQLGFEGAVVSDCLSMTGAEVGDMKVRAIRALEAGCDMAMMCNQPRELVLEVLNFLKDSFKANIESQARIAILSQRKQALIQREELSSPPLTWSIKNTENTLTKQPTVTVFEKDKVTFH